MDNSVKIERQSPLMFEYRYEMDTNSDSSPEGQKYTAKIESPQQFQQQILQSPFMTDKSSSPLIHMFSTQNDESTANIAIVNGSVNSKPSCSRDDTAHHLPLATSAMAANSNQQHSPDACYSYVNDQPLCSSPSPRQISSATTTLISATSSIQCSSSHPCSSDIPCSSCIPSSSNVSCSTSIACSNNNPSSSGMACLTANSPTCSSGEGVTDLMIGDVDVSSLNGSSVSISRRTPDSHQLLADDRPTTVRDLEPATRPMQGQKTGAGISDAVTKILDNVDWSIIPMANKYVKSLLDQIYFAYRFCHCF